MRLLLVEDDDMLGKATLAGLKTSYAVDWVRTGGDAELAIAATPYDLVLLDINLPDKSGLDILKSMRIAKDDRPVLFLTAKDTTRHRIEGLNAGADDYLVKPFDLDELLARCAALIRRSQGRARPHIECKHIILDPLARTVHKDGVPVTLSGRELGILEILMGHIGKIVSRAMIEDHIYDWSSADSFESNAVEVHISSLRRKLGKGFIRTIRGIGYSIDP